MPARDIDRRRSQYSKQPIYSFSYEKGGVGAYDLGDDVDLYGNVAGDPTAGNEDIRVLDKKLVTRGGRIRKGTVFRSLEKQVEQLQKLGKLMIGGGDSKKKSKNKIETERKKLKTPSKDFRAGSMTKK